LGDGLGQRGQGALHGVIDEREQEGGDILGAGGGVRRRRREGRGGDAGALWGQGRGGGGGADQAGVCGRGEVERGGQRGEGVRAGGQADRALKVADLALAHAAEGGELTLGQTGAEARQAQERAQGEVSCHRAASSRRLDVPVVCWLVLISRLLRCWSCCGGRGVSLA